MKRFTDAGRRSLAEGNLYSALTLALTLPDICASLEDPGPGKAQRRYVEWCEAWLVPRFTLRGTVWISGEELFQLRCSLVHSGSTEIDPKKNTKYHKFEFFSSGSHLNYACNSINGHPAIPFVQLRVDLFCEEIFKAAETWDSSISSNELLQKRKQALLIIHKPGTTIHGVSFS